MAIQEKSTPESEKTPPLVRVVYRAARANKAKQALEYLAQAGQLIEQKADVNAEGPDGRTALHWVVLGAMDAEKDKLRQSYLELAERLLEHGAKVDCEDHYGKTRHREIVYAPGVEMTLRVTAPVKLAEMAKASTPLDLPVSKALADLANEQPLRTNTPNGIPSDITNVLLLGAREKIEAAFRAAGWEEGNALSLNSGFKTFVAAAESKGCKEEPVSVLLLDGRKADLIYQKQNNTIAKRHHIRMWLRAATYQGKEIWLGAATHDIAIAVHRKGPHWTHQIDPRIDLEREKIANDLIMTGMVQGRARVERPAAPKTASIATGEEITTDGEILVLVFE